MSRQLPASPNLEFLKKQAKDRLESLRLDDPAAKLADALHATARDYGFTNWAELKTHVESAARTSRPHPFAGTWIARSPESGPATLSFQIDAAAVTVADDNGINTLTTDGRDQPARHGYTTAARWTSPHALEAIGKKEGRVVGRVLYTVSADGTTLTIASEVAGHDNYPASRSSRVYRRS